MVERNVYCVQDMRVWDDVGADLAIVDPPFGIEFDGTPRTYNRKYDAVVDGYVEWPVEEYAEEIETMLDVLGRNLHGNGQIVVFSGWNNSHLIHQQIREHTDFRLEGKQYWSYNFAPYCTRRPAHNVNEVFWAVKSDDWYYKNECSYDHCQEGEANLAVIDVNRTYMRNDAKWGEEIPKYPTRKPTKLFKIVLEHYSEEGDTVFNPLAGSGALGIAAQELDREYVLGDKNENGKEVFEALKTHL